MEGMISFALFNDRQDENSRIIEMKKANKLAETFRLEN